MKAECYGCGELFDESEMDGECCCPECAEQLAENYTDEDGFDLGECEELSTDCRGMCFSDADPGL